MLHWLQPADLLQLPEVGRWASGAPLGIPTPSLLAFSVRDAETLEEVCSWDSPGNGFKWSSCYLVRGMSLRFSTFLLLHLYKRDDMLGGWGWWYTPVIPLLRRAVKKKKIINRESNIHVGIDSHGREGRAQFLLPVSSILFRSSILTSFLPGRSPLPAFAFLQCFACSRLFLFVPKFCLFFKTPVKCLLSHKASHLPPGRDVRLQVLGFYPLCKASPCVYSHSP